MPHGLRSAKLWGIASFKRFEGAMKEPNRQFSFLLFNFRPVFGSGSEDGYPGSIDFGVQRVTRADIETGEYLLGQNDCKFAVGLDGLSSCDHGLPHKTKALLHGKALRSGAAEAKRSHSGASVTLMPSSSSEQVSWQERREFGCTASAMSSISTSPSEGGLSFSYQPSSM